MSEEKITVLKTYYKQPGDVQDYDIGFTAWLAGLADTADSVTVTASTGITVDSYSLSGSVVKVWLSGGTANQRYVVTAALQTVGGRTKEGEIAIKVIEV